MVATKVSTLESSLRNSTGQFTFASFFREIIEMLTNKTRNSFRRRSARRSSHANPLNLISDKRRVTDSDLLRSRSAVGKVELLDDIISASLTRRQTHLCIRKW